MDNYMMVSLLFLGLLFGILSKSTLCMNYALQAVHIWINSMMPALLPFMILSGIMIRMNLAEKTAGVLSPVFQHLFDCSKAGCYCILIGFVCGFPMGAKTIADLYAKSRISEEEGRRLLAFCNNIGPSYLMGFVIPLLGIRHPVLCLLGFYGIPFLYGIFLCRISKTFHPKYAGDPCNESNPGKVNAPKQYGKNNTDDFKMTASLRSFLKATQESVVNSMNAILILGGYLILFCMLNLIPHWIFGRQILLLGPFFEITSGLQNLQGSRPIYSLVMLSFGGLCCLAQTHASLQAGDLTKYFGEYAFHKSMQAVLTFLYFSLLKQFLPNFI